MQKFKVLLYDGAVEDYKNAIDYYSNISPKVVNKFHNAINSTFNELKKNPFYQIRYDKMRMKLVKNFPYLIHFMVDENANTVLVYGIRNAYRNPATSYFFDE